MSQRRKLHRRSPHNPGRSALLALAFALTAADGAQAQERFFRLFDEQEGLSPSEVNALAQDRVGFLWIGTQGGLVRYDGIEMRRWSPDVLDRQITTIAASPKGPVVVLRNFGALFA